MQAIQDIYDKLYNIRVDGVKVHQSYPPYTFNSADYPLLFFREMKFALDYESSFSATLVNSLPSNLNVSGGSVEMVVIVESFRQGTSAQNYSKTRDIINAISDAINSSTLAFNMVSMSIEEDFELAGETVLFVIKTTINFKY